jgi:hypothetical protein
MGQIFKPASNTMARASVLSLGILPWVVFWAGSTISRGPANTRQDVPLNQPVPFSHRHHAYELGIDCRYCHTAVEKSAMASVPPTETCMSCHSQIWTNSPLLEPIRRSYETGMPVTWNTGEVGWNKVNKVPEFVYFNHSIHVARGINCNTCHGPIQKMTITWKGHAFAMAWCLECHREPEKYIFKDKDHPNDSPRQQVFDIYRDFQAGRPLTPRKQALFDGEDYTPTAAEIKEGQALVEEYKIKKQQLTDCWICHR